MYGLEIRRVVMDNGGNLFSAATDVGSHGNIVNVDSCGEIGLCVGDKRTVRM
jgi:hypothetical protein